jgi:dGTPase
VTSREPRLRELLEKAEDAALGPWAVRSSRSRGRLHPEGEHRYRTAFQRDRDRVIHASAFRRLQYKTQVFVYHEGDHFRNRLTHTLEAAQIARTVSRVLGANEDLVEAIVLAHDLGHTPFGHSGERAVHALMAQHGGFEHNRQSLRIVDLLEVRSSAYSGLNLTHETRAGVLKHGSEFPRYGHPVALPELGACPTLEAQIADIADEIAYDNHDIDDGLRSGLIEADALAEVPIWRHAWESSAGEAGGGASAAASGRVRRKRAIAALIDTLVSDLIETSHRRLLAARVSSAAEVQAATERMIALSGETTAALAELSRFLRESLYQHPQVLRMAAKAERILRDLWEAYTNDPRLLPTGLKHTGAARESGAPEPRERAICDYLAGMTDRFAMDEHRKLFDPHAHV